MNEAALGEFRVESEADIVAARKIVRKEATALGFSITDVTRIVTAASELTRNIYQHAGAGVMRWQALGGETSAGLELIFKDRGPGILDVSRAMERGFTTGNGLGLGLPGSKRLMDEMTIESTVGEGTTVVVRKWLQHKHAMSSATGH